MMERMLEAWDWLRDRAHDFVLVGLVACALYGVHKANDWAQKLNRFSHDVVQELQRLDTVQKEHTLLIEQLNVAIGGKQRDDHQVFDASRFRAHDVRIH